MLLLYKKIECLQEYEKQFLPKPLQLMSFLGIILKVQTPFEHKNRILCGRERGNKMEEKTIRRSKIYTYFYGRNTVFQKFLILVGALFILLSSIAGVANRKGFEKKLDKVREEYYAADTAYDKEYDNLRWELGIRVVRGQEAEVEAEDQYKTEKNKYNDALEKFKKAEEKYNDMRSKGSSKGFLGGLCTFIGIVSLVGGLGWIVYKKWSINYVGQAEYDAELAKLTEEAKTRGLEKLNIVAEQVDSIEPVVLDGEGVPEAAAVEAVGKIKNMLSKALQFVLVERADQVLSAALLPRIAGEEQAELLMPMSEGKSTRLRQ
jgi:hypothetical protein